jgi:hypothetical protein
VAPLIDTAGWPFPVRPQLQTDLCDSESDNKSRDIASVSVQLNIPDPESSFIFCMKQFSVNNYKIASPVLHHILSRVNH